MNIKMNIIYTSRIVKIREVKRNQQQMYRQERGFTVVETLVALLLVVLAAAFIGNTILCSIDSQRRSTLRFNMCSQLEFYKNRLLAVSFDAPGMATGNYEEESGPFKLTWTIMPISPDLKIVRLTISFLYRDKHISKDTYLYKSRYIKNPVNL